MTSSDLIEVFLAEDQVLPRWLRDEAYQAEAARVVSMYAPLVEPLALAFGPDSEALVHDFSRLPNSIVAISGTISGRQVGGPCTDLGLRDLLADPPPRYRAGYQSQLPNGRTCRSTSIYLYGDLARPVGSLCINSDVSSLAVAREVLGSLLGLTSSVSGTQQEPVPAEHFYQTVEQAAAGILETVIRSTGVPTEMMSRRHKVLLVRELDSRGFFLLRGAAELAATALSVSKYSIYNYLNETDKELDED